MTSERTASRRWLPASARKIDVAAMLVRAVRRRPLVVSFPKAGRTWLRAMLDELSVRAEYTHFGAGVALALPVEELVPSPWWVARRPTLLLVRDPRDTLVSSFHQATRRRKVYAGTLTDFVRDPRFGIEKVVRWNLMWAQLARVEEGIALTSYEALRAEGPALLGEIARHLGASPSAAALEAAWKSAEFDAMRKRERSGEVERRHRHILGMRTPGDPNSAKVRRGVIGGYRDELTPDDADYCDRVVASHGYEAKLAEAMRERGLRARA
jgi:hypothetical protein